MLRLKISRAYQQFEIFKEQKGKMGNQAAKKAQKNSNQTRGRNWMVKWNDTWRLRRQGLEPSLKNEPIKRPVLSTKTLASLAGARVSAGERGWARASAGGLLKVSRGAGGKERLTNNIFQFIDHTCQNLARIWQVNTLWRLYCKIF